MKPTSSKPFAKHPIDSMTQEARMVYEYNQKRKAQEEEKRRLRRLKEERFIASQQQGKLL